MTAPEIRITDWALSEAGRIVRQVEAEQASVRAARYATRREVAGAFVTQPFAAVREAGGQPWYEPGSRTVAVDLTGTGAKVDRPAPPAPLGAISARLVDGITYPDPHDLTGGLNPRLYAQALRHIGMATGTCSPYESDAAWRLAIETGATS